MNSAKPIKPKNLTSPAIETKAKPRKSAASYFAPEMLARIRALGSRIKLARIHRKWRQEDLVGRSGLSRSTIEAIERGEPNTAISSYLHVLWIMGLDKDLDILADPGLDREGLTLAFSVSDKRVRIPKKVNNDF